jgi:hypothetical protein
VSLFVDTSVWSLAMRRDAPAETPETSRLREALSSQKPTDTTGIVLQKRL